MCHGDRHLKSEKKRIEKKRVAGGACCPRCHIHLKEKPRDGGLPLIGYKHLHCLLNHHGEPLCSPSPRVDRSPFQCGEYGEELIVFHVIRLLFKMGCYVQFEGAQMGITEMAQG